MLQQLVAALRRHRLPVEQRLLGPGRRELRQLPVEGADQRLLVLPAGGCDRCTAERAAARVDGREALEEAGAIALRHRLGEEQIDEAAHAHLGCPDRVGLRQQDLGDTGDGRFLLGVEGAQTGRCGTRVQRGGEGWLPQRQERQSRQQCGNARERSEELAPIHGRVILCAVASPGRYHTWRPRG